MERIDVEQVRDILRCIEEMPSDINEAIIETQKLLGEQTQFWKASRLSFLSRLISQPISLLAKSWLEQSAEIELLKTKVAHAVDSSELIKRDKAINALRAGLEYSVHEDNCSGTSCPRPTRAMCSNRGHAIRRDAIAAADKILGEK